MTIQMTSVQSTSISSIGYRRRTMQIEFSSGRVYSYSKVPRSTYDSFAKSQSKGKFFNEEIREKFSQKEI